MTWSGTGPEPDPLPDAVWLFDGVCNFCSASVSLVLRLDSQGAVRFSPMQSAYGRALAERCGIDPEAPSTFLFIDAGRALGRSDAVIALLRRLPAPWRWAAAARFIPKPWREAAYDWLAVNRYRLFGRRKTCRMPTEAERARFIVDP